MNHQYHYATPAVVIGRHQWRLIVKDSAFGGRSTEYQWRSSGSQAWRPDTEWPTYNGDDGTYAGCPQSLRSCVWDPNVEAIRAALAGNKVCVVGQLELPISAEPAVEESALPAPILEAVERAYTIEHLVSLGKLELNHPDERRLMCWILPPWQRPEKWSEHQKRRFIEGIFLGLGTGFYVVHGADYQQDGRAKPMSGWLIDGQQRTAAIRDFLDDKLTIFNGLRWADLDQPTRWRRFLRVPFPARELAYTANEVSLMEISNRLNFGGTPHELNEMALVPAFPDARA
ncbi:MAG: DUF262 domain-containing protein [Cupriavidus sp.]|nr:MAG: DUF262 domain-containing protein [Cupriavidus sp.]